MVSSGLNGVSSINAVSNAANVSDAGGADLGGQLPKDTILAREVARTIIRPVDMRDDYAKKMIDAVTLNKAGSIVESIV
jgi:hypothetical protein